MVDQLATIEYVEIPECATHIQQSTSDTDVHAAPKVITSLPHPLPEKSSPVQPTSPLKPVFNLPQILLSSSMHLPSPPPSAPRGGVPHLLSTRAPLSIPITTSNFRRFVSKSGPVFWLQDRVEEILMWRKGWKVTVCWMAGYAFLCYFPRMVLLLPHLVLLAIILSSHEETDQLPDGVKPISLPAQPSEGTVDWYSNLQAIQNLMGAYSDLHDVALLFIPHLTYATPYTKPLLTFTVVTLIFLIPIINLLPLRATFFVLGLAPFIITHPLSQRIIPVLTQPMLKRARVRLQRAVDDNRLEDKHWISPLREVELWENERWVGSTTGSGWSKVNLKPTERKGWTRGRDGCSDLTGEVSNLTFALSPGWLFVETEDWREDLEAGWAEVGSDDNGWVYTNDAWLEPQPTPLDDRKSSGITRRRRWTRRIYYDPSSSA